MRIELKAEGLFRPGLPPSALAEEARLPRPLALEVKTRLAFNERVVKPAPPGGGASSERRRAARWVTQAASAINGEIRATSSALRPELSLLLAERTGGEGALVVVSPSGPLTRPELELVQGPGDPLTLADLLPAGDAAKGHSWKLPASAAIALSGYDVVKRTTLEAAVEQLDEATARIRFKGDVEGSALGGRGRSHATDS